MSASLKANEPSMEEILASIRRIIADDQKDQPAPEPAAVAAPEPQPVEEEDDVLDLATVSPSAWDEADDDDIAFKEEPEEPLLVLPKKPEPAPPPPEPPQAVAPEPAPPPPPPPPPVSDDALLSPMANASVASTFNMLSSAILTSQARTLEDLVKDMMRPMLKAWLDDNLPVMVERLVKAEIERVARGGR